MKQEFRDIVVRKVLRTVQQGNLFPQGEKVVVAVSGGCDSVTLLDILLHFRDKWKLGILVGHLNHTLRGNESDRDEDFVKGLAERHGLKFLGGRTDVRKCARDRKLSVEEAARQARYEFLRSAALGSGSRTIATAHNADDVVETVLMRIIRGTGRAGLSGIPVKRSFEECTVVRPLIEAWRTEIIRFAAGRKLRYVTDSSNLELVHTRNKIRNELIPALQSYNPGVKEVILRMSQTMGEEHDYLVDTAGKAFKRIADTGENAVSMQLKKLLKFPPALQALIIRCAIRHARGSLTGITQKHLDQLETMLSSSRGTLLRLPGDVTVRKSSGKVIIQAL